MCTVGVTTQKQPHAEPPEAFAETNSGRKKALGTHHAINSSASLLRRPVCPAPPVAILNLTSAPSGPYTSAGVIDVRSDGSVLLETGLMDAIVLGTYCRLLLVLYWR